MKFAMTSLSPETTQQHTLPSPPGCLMGVRLRDWESSCHYEGQPTYVGPWQSRPTRWPLNSKHQLLSAAVGLSCRHSVSEAAQPHSTVSLKIYTVLVFGLDVVVLLLCSMLRLTGLFKRYENNICIRGHKQKFVSGHMPCSKPHKLCLSVAS